MKNIFILCLIFWGCKPINEPGADCRTMLINNPEPLSPESTDFTIQKVVRDGNFLKMTIAHGGGCGIFQFELLLAKSLAGCGYPQSARLVFTTNNSCKRLDTTEICFDISLLRRDSSCYKTLNIQGFATAIAL